MMKIEELKLKDIYSNFKALRKERGFSQEGLARKVNITSSALCQIEKRKVNPSMETFFKLLKELGLELQIRSKLC